MPRAIKELADRYLTNPAEVSVTPTATTVDRVAQSVTMVNQAEKTALLAMVLRSSAVERALVFSRTKHGADKIVRQLEAAGIAAGAIHGNKSQAQRERALAGFKSGDMPVLVATDIAARGIDIPGVSHVVNFDLPDVPEQYVHRIGRTARAGADGIAIAFCSPDRISWPPPRRSSDSSQPRPSRSSVRIAPRPRRIAVAKANSARTVTSASSAIPSVLPRIRDTGQKAASPSVSSAAGAASAAVRVGRKAKISLSYRTARGAKSSDADCLAPLHDRPAVSQPAEPSRACACRVAAFAAFRPRLACARTHARVTSGRKSLYLDYGNRPQSERIWR